MSEPITLYREGVALVTNAPSEATRLLGEGWTLTPVVTEVTPEPDPMAWRPEPAEVVPFTVRKTGRPKKAQ